MDVIRIPTLKVAIKTDNIGMPKHDHIKSQISPLPTPATDDTNMVTIKSTNVN